MISRISGLTGAGPAGPKRGASISSRAEPDAVCVTHEAEMTDSVWITAADAVRHFEDGGLRLLPPTIHTLRRRLVVGRGNGAGAHGKVRSDA